MIMHQVPSETVRSLAEWSVDLRAVYSDKKQSLCETFRWQSSTKDMDPISKIAVQATITCQGPAECLLKPHEPLPSKRPSEIVF